MKRAIKGILITSGILFVMGLAVLLSGFLMGASWSQIGETILSNKYAIGGDYWGNNSDLKDMELIADSKSYDTKEIRDIYIDVGAGSLEVTNTDSDKIKLTNEEDRGKLGVKIEGGVMTIALRSKNRSNGGKAKIELPKNLQLDSAFIDLSAGTVELDSIKAKEFVADVGAGKLESKGKIISENSTWNIEAGKIEAKWVESRETNLNCSAGTIMITLSGEEGDYAVEGECSAGKLEIGSNSYHDDVTLNASSSKEDYVINANCSAGKIAIDFEK